MLQTFIPDPPWLKCADAIIIAIVFIFNHAFINNRYMSIVASRSSFRYIHLSCGYLWIPRRYSSVFFNQARRRYTHVIFYETSRISFRERTRSLVAPRLHCWEGKCHETNREFILSDSEGYITGMTPLDRSFAREEAKRVRGLM